MARVYAARAARSRAAPRSLTRVRARARPTTRTGPWRKSTLVKLAVLLAIVVALTVLGIVFRHQVADGYASLQHFMDPDGPLRSFLDVKKK